MKKSEKQQFSSEEVTQFTKFEKARMVGSRALQISMGAPFLVTLSDDDLKKLRYDPIEIALREFAEGIIPITVRRPKTGSH